MIPSSGKHSYRPVSILFLDLEGGYGGSSRSMFYLVNNLDRSMFSPVVLLRKRGPIIEKYKFIGVPFYVVENFPSFRPGERKRPIMFALFLFQMCRFPRILSKVKMIVERHRVQIIHVNHESLGLSGFTLAKRLTLPWVCHIRTQLVSSFFSRLVYRTINHFVDRIIFITDQNMTHFSALVGKSFKIHKASVVRNIIPRTPVSIKPLPELEADPRKFKIISLSNFSPNRGIDRIVEVAEELKRRGRDDFLFFLFGRAAHRRLISGRESPYANEIRNRVKEAELEEMVVFPGHTEMPERALAGADALIKLTREANPWGRDIMEGMAAGLPIITLGAYEGFVENGTNGYIELTYNVKKIADYLVHLRDRPDLLKKIRRVNIAKAQRIFDGRVNAGLIQEIYKGVLREKGWYI